MHCKPRSGERFLARGVNRGLGGLGHRKPQRGGTSARDPGSERCNSHAFTRVAESTLKPGSWSAQGAAPLGLRAHRARPFPKATPLLFYTSRLRSIYATRTVYAPCAFAVRPRCSCAFSVRPCCSPAIVVRARSLFALLIACDHCSPQRGSDKVVPRATPWGPEHKNAGALKGNAVNCRN